MRTIEVYHRPNARDHIIPMDDPRVLASPVPDVTRDYLLALHRLRQGLTPRGPAERRPGSKLDDRRRRLLAGV